MIQVFTASARSWTARPYRDEELLAWEAARARTGVRPVMSHASYLINLAAPRPADRRKAMRALAEELERCRRLAIPYLVLHPGAHMGAGEVAGVARIAAAIDRVFEGRPDDPTRLLLENTAGQGTCVGHRLEHLRDLLGASRYPQRLGVCLDTQHLHAAGYELASPAGWAATLQALERTVGSQQVRAFHLNDSKRPRGARVDRHEHIGRGFLGLDPFRRLLAEPRFAQVPMALETPKGKESREDLLNLGVLRALEWRARVGPRARALAAAPLPPAP